MKLNHLHLTVTDVLATENFLATYFGLHSPRSEADNRNFGVMFDDDGMVLTLMKAGHSTEVKYPGHFHIGFGQPTDEHVNALYQRLKDDGFDIEPPQRAHAWSFYVEAPGGFTIEVLC